MMQYLVLVILALAHASSERIRYVKPTDSTLSCPSQPCLIFEEYAAQSKKYLTTGTTFLFLAGNHSVDTTISLQNVSNMTFKGKENESDVTIVSNAAQVMILTNATNIRLQGITLRLYKGHTLGTTLSSYSALVTINCQKIQFFNMTFEGTADMKNQVRAANCTHSNVEFVSCLFRGNAGSLGGAIAAINGSNVTLDGNVFIENVAIFSGGAIFVNNSVLILMETMGNTFSHNLAMENGGALFLLDSRIIIEGNENAKAREVELNCTSFSQDQSQHGPVLITEMYTTYFLNNEAHDERGGAMYIVDSMAWLSGTCIIFHNNSAPFCGGAFCSDKSSVTLNAKQSCFTKNRAGSIGGAICGIDDIWHINGDAYFAENCAGFSGGAYRSQNSNLYLTGSVYLSNNYAGNQGGAMHLWNTKAFFCGPAVDFVANSAQVYGGGLSLSDSEVQFGKCINSSAYQDGGSHGVHFINNTAIVGGAVRAYNCYITFNGNVRISGNEGGGINAAQSVIYFTGNAAFEGNHAVEKGGGAIEIIFESTLFISGNMEFKNNTAIGLYGGAIFASDCRTKIIFHGNVTFISNRAEYGGALSFQNGATMILISNTTITTSFNHATKHGGAIYHRDHITPIQCMFAISENNEVPFLPTCFMDLVNPDIFSNGNYSISSVYDSAGSEGSFLYGGLLDKCLVFVTSTEIFPNGTTLYDSHDKLLYSTLIKYVFKVKSKDQRPMSSEAYELCFCESNQEFNCSEVKNLMTYRGRKFAVSVMALAQGDTPTSTLLRAKLNATARLKQDQILQTHLQNCSEVSYNLYSTEEQEQLILYPDGGSCHDIGMARAVINVTFLPCPNGFTLSGDECICEERLQKYKPECRIYDNEIYIIPRVDSKFWANGSYSPNGTYQGLILYQSCPIEYCKAQPVNISLNQPDVQCDHNRSGLLCGACAANHSLMLGTCNCQECSDVYLTLLIPFAAAGIALVVFLSALRLTVATGMINSIILYANILQANRDLLYPSSANTTNVLTVFIAWMNLDLGFQACFYHGLDAIAQTWLQYAFPVYVWLIIIFIILASRYSIIVTKLIGTNPIAVLATLLLLSYTKVLNIIIEVYFSVKLEHPNNKTVTVWLKDANEPYLDSRHLVLTIVTTLTLVFLFLPYTFLLLLGYKLYPLSRKKHFRFLNLIKPLSDSYYAPYKNHTRYWTGILLLARCALYCVFSFNSLGATTKSLLTIIVSVTAIILWLSIGIYTSFFKNLIEGFVYLNLISLSAAELAGVNSPVVANSLVGIVFAIMVGIMVYQFHVIFIANSASYQKLLTRMTSLTGYMKKCVATDAIPLLDPVADTPTQRPIVTRSVVSVNEPPLTEN